MARHDTIQEATKTPTREIGAADERITRWEVVSYIHRKSINQRFRIVEEEGMSIVNLNGNRWSDLD